ncbi:MAG TPA: hypothetical protein VIJ95_05225, partial [Hanamia sp.]
SYSFIQAQASGGNQILDFDISQGKSGTYYATSAYYSTTQGKGATMMKELGTLSFAENGLSCDWGDASSSSNDGNAGFGNSDLEHAGNAIQTGVDVNSSTWKAMSEIGGASKTLAKMADGATVAGIVVAVTTAGTHILSGNGTWRDGVTLGVAGLTGIAMATGVGEVAVGIGAIGWDIWNAVTQDN